METRNAASSVRRTSVRTQQPHPEQAPAQERRLRRLIGALRSLDDRTLSQIGIERREIERFAQAEVAYNL